MAYQFVGTHDPPKAKRPPLNRGNAKSKQAAARRLTPAQLAHRKAAFEQNSMAGAVTLPELKPPTAEPPARISKPKVKWEPQYLSVWSESRLRIVGEGVDTLKRHAEIWNRKHYKFQVDGSPRPESLLPPDQYES